jgi:hypothetical protein
LAFGIPPRGRSQGSDICIGSDPHNQSEEEEEVTGISFTKTNLPKQQIDNPV